MISCQWKKRHIVRHETTLKFVPVMHEPFSPKGPVGTNPASHIMHIYSVGWTLMRTSTVSSSEAALDRSLCSPSKSPASLPACGDLIRLAIVPIIIIIGNRCVPPQSGGTLSTRRLPRFGVSSLINGCVGWACTAQSYVF